MKASASIARSLVPKHAAGRRHWKATNNDIVERYLDGISRLRFQPIAAHLTPRAMDDLTSRYSTALDQHLVDSLVLAPLAMLDLLCIYRFPDGNGRMSRLLTSLLLCHFDNALGRYISLERIFEDTTDGYYETLEASSLGCHEGPHDVKTWLDYFWGALLQAHLKFEERVGTIERGRGSKGDRVWSEVLGRTLPFSILQIEEAYPGVSSDIVRLVPRANEIRRNDRLHWQGRGANGSSKRNGNMVELIDKISRLLGDDLKQTIRPESRLRARPRAFELLRNSLNIRGQSK